MIELNDVENKILSLFADSGLSVTEVVAMGYSRKELRGIMSTIFKKIGARNLHHATSLYSQEGKQFQNNNKELFGNIDFSDI